MSADDRLVSLDVTRGFTVAAMIFVNAVAYFHYAAAAPVPEFLLHADWIGFTFADFVFPAFIFIMGVSIAFAMEPQKEAQAAGKAMFRKILLRSLKLIVAGFILSNLYNWYYSLEVSQIRCFGVLQRIGIVYFVAANLFLLLPNRMLALLTAGILLFYGPLTLLAIPSQGGADLMVAGSNFVSWFDRTVLGDHAYVKGLNGYDPEGILSTLPTIAQALAGALLGVWLRTKGRSSGVAAPCLGLAVALVLSGALLSPIFPISKDIWSVSYVLVSSGVTVALFVLCFLFVDIMQRRGWFSQFFEDFGRNAITAYILHHIFSFTLAAAPMIAIYKFAALYVDARIAAIIPALLFLWLNWLAVRWLRMRRIYVAI